MKRFHANDQVDPGIYLNLRQLSFKSMSDEGRLPGTEKDVYRRVPALVLLVAGPLLGLAYVIFLPLLGFVMLAGFLLRKGAEVAAEAAAAAARVLRPAWQPARAFLTRGKPAKRPEGGKDRWAEEVERELEDEAPAASHEDEEDRG